MDAEGLEGIRRSHFRAVGAFPPVSRGISHCRISSGFEVIERILPFFHKDNTRSPPLCRRGGRDGFELGQLLIRTTSLFKSARKCNDVRTAPVTGSEMRGG